MKSIKLIFASLLIAFIFIPSLKADDLNTKKMEQITKDILENMLKQDNTSEYLRKYISEDWLEKNRLNVK
jgi:hypothetical protein